MAVHSIKWAKFHSDIFLSGTNLGDKIDVKLRPGLTIKWHDDTSHLVLDYKGNRMYVPCSACFWVPFNEGEEEALTAMRKGADPQAPQKQVVEEMVIRKKITAQVETPHGHVHGGLGAGKTGK